MNEPHEKVYRSRKRIMIDNFIGGIAWGIGTTIGLSIFLALVSFLMSKIDLVPFVGNFVADVTAVVEEQTQKDK